MIKDKLKNKRIVSALVVLGLIAVFLIFFAIRGNAPVEAFIVSEGPFSEKIVAIGQLGLEQETTLVAEVSGNIDGVYASESQTVNRGSILLEIEKQVTLDYESAQSEYTRANSRRSYAASAYENAVALYAEGAVSEQEMKAKKLDYETALSQFYSAQLTLQQVAENLSRYKISAPWDAVVLKIYTHVGDYVQAGDPLVDIGSIGGYRISAELDEKYFPYITEGLPVVISVGDGYAGTAAASINNITPKINQNTGTFEIDILLPEDYPYKASNLTVNLEIKVNEAANVIVIPQSYLIEKAGPDKAFVFVYEQGRAIKTPIDIQSGISSTVLVSDGLSAGDILLLPQEGLQDGDTISKYKEANAS